MRNNQFRVLLCEGCGAVQVDPEGRKINYKEYSKWLKEQEQKTKDPSIRFEVGDLVTIKKPQEEGGMKDIPVIVIDCGVRSCILQYPDGTVKDELFASYEITKEEITDAKERL